MDCFLKFAQGAVKVLLICFLHTCRYTAALVLEVLYEQCSSKAALAALPLYATVK